MLIKAWRLLTIVLVALSLAPALGHLLELPAKMTYDGTLWVTLQQTLYGAFGTVGGAFEIGAVITTVVLAILVRHRRPAFGWTLFAAVCMVAMHAAFWIWLAPVNSTIAAISLDALPANWMDLRSQWEYTHAARAIIQIIALAALVFSVLVETPTDPVRQEPMRR